MSTRVHFLTPLAACLVLSGAFAYGQDSVAVRPEAAKRDQGIRLSQMTKYKILIQDDKPAGQVVDFVLSDGGCIDYVVASYEDQYYVIPYSAATVRYDDSIVFVDLPQARFEQVQFFAADAWPDFYVPDYRNQIFTTFDVDVIRRDGRANFRGDRDRDGDGDGDDRADDRRDRAEDRRDRRQENREGRKDRRDDEDRKGDLDNTPDTDRPAVPDRDRPKSKPAPKADPTPKTAPKNDPKLPKTPEVKPPKPETGNPKPNNPAPKLPTPKKPTTPEKPAPK